MPDLIDLLLVPFLVAAGVSFIVMLVGVAPWRSGKFQMNWVGPMALASGILAPFKQVTGAIPSFPPMAAMGWIFYLIAVSAVVGILLASLRMPWWIRALAVVAICAVSFALVLLNQLKDPQTVIASAGWIIVMALVAAIWWQGLETVARDWEPVTAPLAMLILALFSALLLMISDSLTYGRMGLSIGGAVAPLALIILIRREVRAKGSVLVFVIALGALLLVGKVYAQLTALNLTLLCVAPLMMTLRKMIPHSRANGFQGICISLSLLMLPLLIAAC